MSYLDKNPFNRPTPTFNTNPNTFNTYSTYSTYDYLTDKKSYSYSNKYQSQYKHFSSNSQSPQYKYSRAVQDSPFITGSNPFTASTANYTYNKSPSINSPYQRDSYQSKKQYSYSPSLSNVSGFTDPYQEPYFKTDKFQDRFKKSNFQQDIEIQLEKSRDNQTRPNYLSSNKQIKISKLLQNNPFLKPSLQSHKNNYDSYQPLQSNLYTKNLHQNQPSQNQYQNQYNSQAYLNKYYQNQLRFQQKIQPLTKQTQNQNSKQDKYAHLIYKKNGLITSDVKNIQEFDKFSETIPSSESMKYLQNDKYERYSQNGSRNTFINKISDLISSDNEQNNVPFQQTYEGRHKKSLENPFSKSNNPFAKTSLISKQSQKSKTQLSGKELSISSENSIKFEDFIDIETKKRESLKKQSQGNYVNQLFKRSKDKLFQSQGSKRSYEQKVDDQFQKWGRESGKKSLSIFESQRLGRDWKDQSDNFSKKSLKNQNVKYQNFRDLQKLKVECQNLNEGRKKDNYVLEEEKRIFQNSMGKDIKYLEEKNFSKKGSLKIELQQKESFKQNKEKVEFKKGQNRKQEGFRFSRQIFQDQDDEQDSVVQEYKNGEQDYGLKRISEVDFSQQRQSQSQSKRESRSSGNKQKAIQKQESNSLRKQQKKQQSIYSKQPMYSKQRQQIYQKQRPKIYSIQRQLADSQWREQNKEDKVSYQKQILNREQRIDQKLSKYKYHYQKQQPISKNQQQSQHKPHSINNQPYSISNRSQSYQPYLVNNQPYQLNSPQFSNQNIKNSPTHLNDFIDLNLQHSNDSFLEQSSFQQVNNINYNQQFTPHPIPKRVNLKQRVISNLKNDSLSSQKILQQLPLNTEPHPQFILNKTQNYQNKNQTQKDQNKNQQEENYEFQSLDEFQGKYKYNMKESGFDFQEDEFQETQRHLGLDDQENITKKDNNKILVPQYGYEDRDNINRSQDFQAEQMKITQKQKINKQVPLRRYISSISSNNEDVIKKSDLKDDLEDFLPSFNMKLQQKIHRLSEVQTKNVTGSEKDMIKKVNNYTEQTIIPQNKRNNQIQVLKNQQIKQSKKGYQNTKVQKVKIYDSQSQSEGYRNSGQYKKYEQNLNFKQSQKFQPKIYKSQASNMQQSQTQQYYKSPFQQKTQNLSTLQSNLNNKHINNSQTLQRVQKSINQRKESLQQKSHSRDSQNYQKVQIQRYQKPQILNLYQQNIKQSLKYSNKHERDYSPTFNSLRSSQKSDKQPPVRDSFDFTAPVRDSFDFSKRQDKDQYKMKKNKKQSINKYPSMLQYQGNIYHLIQFTQ